MAEHKVEVVCAKPGCGVRAWRWPSALACGRSYCSRACKDADHGRIARGSGDPVRAHVALAHPAYRAATARGYGRERARVAGHEARRCAEWLAAKAVATPALPGEGRAPTTAG